MTLGEEAVGRVWLAWPYRALFHTGEPPVRLMGLEGRTARLVDLDARSCDEHRLSEREWERFPLAALLDPAGTEDRFDLEVSGNAGVVLRPRQPGGVDRVEVDVGDDGLPAGVVIVDPQGATNRFRFTGWSSASGPPDGAWLPAKPLGVECVADRGALD